MVRHRWHECAHAPELCRTVVLYGATWPRNPPLAFSAALASLTAWLLRHGQHVRSLRLYGWGEEGAAAEAQSHLACCLMACAGGQLEALGVNVRTLVAAGWAPLLHTLCRLHLGRFQGELLISSSLHSLTQLTVLALEGSPIRFAAGARLPASVEQLWVADDLNYALPAQVRNHGQLLLGSRACMCASHPVLCGS